MFNSYDFQYRRHLTKDQAEALKNRWDYDGEDEQRSAKILYKKKTDDYTVVLSKRYNS